MDSPRVTAEICVLAPRLRALGAARVISDSGGWIFEHVLPDHPDAVADRRPHAHREVPRLPLDIDATALVLEMRGA
jgi:hypothetical protein